MSQTLKGKGAAWVQAPDPRGALLSTGHAWILARLRVWDGYCADPADVTDSSLPPC